MLRFARGRFGRFFVRWVFAHSWILRWLSVEVLRETEHVVAMRHPRPSYGVHILLVPKRPFATLLDVPEGDPFTADMLLVAQSLIQELGLDKEGGYRLVSNGGDYQDVPHLHFHLIAS